MIQQGLQFREIGRFEVGLAGHFGKQIQKAVDRSQEGGVIGQLTPELMANLAPQVDIGDGQDVDSNNDEFQEYLHNSGETQPCKHAQMARPLEELSGAGVAFREPG